MGNNEKCNEISELKNQTKIWILDIIKSSIFEIHLIKTLKNIATSNLQSICFFPNIRQMASNVIVRCFAPGEIIEFDSEKKIRFLIQGEIECINVF